MAKHYDRLGKTPPKGIPTIRLEIQALERLAETYSVDEPLCDRIAALWYALIWQQGRASQRPSAWLLEHSPRLDKAMSKRKAGET